MFRIRRVDDQVVELRGRFDAAQEEVAKEVLDQITESAIIDFGGLEYISSAGLGLLLATQKRLMGSGHALRIVNPNPHILEIFTIAGFTKIFEIGDRAPAGDGGGA